MAKLSIMDRFFEALFKKVFSGELKAAEAAAKKIADTMTDEERKKISNHFKKLDDSMANIRKFLK